MYYIFYLLILSSILFINRDWKVLTGLLLLQVVLWLISSVPARSIKMMLKRIWLFLLLVIVAYAFVPTGAEADIWHTLPVGSYAIELNISGLLLALLMCERILCLIMASIWVQHSASAEDFLAGLCRFGIPEPVAIALKHSMALVSGSADGRRGTGDGSGNGQGKPSAENKARPSLRRILRGDLAPVRALMDWAFERADLRLAEHEPDLEPTIRNEISVMISMTLAMMSFKMIVLVPGLMVAPGHKNVILLPLFLIAAQRTQAHLGGMWTGLCMGMVNFMLGFGKLGILELVQFMLTGLLADMLLPFYRGRGYVMGIIQLAFIGAFMGLARFSTNLLLLVLAGAPIVGFAIISPIIVAQILFGALSAFPAKVLLTPPAKTQE